MGSASDGAVRAPPDPYARTLAAIDEGLRGLSLEGWSPRRGIGGEAGELLAALRAPLEGLVAQVRAGAMAASYAVHASTVWTPALGSLLFACGAPHGAWRRWPALGAVASALVGEYRVAVTLGAVAHAWAVVDRVRSTAEGFDASWGGLWRLLGKEPRVDLATVRDAPEAIAAWSALVDAAPGAEAEAALARVIDLARLSDDRVTPDAIAVLDPASGDLGAGPWSPTSDSGTAAAAAAVLARRGWRPSPELGRDRARFVEPGWVEGAPLGGVEAILTFDLPPDGADQPVGTT